VRPSVTVYQTGLAIISHALPDELHKVRPTTLLRFARTTNQRFSWPLVILGLRIGPNIHGLSIGRLRMFTSKVKVKVKR